MWIYSFDYSPGNIGIRAITQSGEEIEQVVSIGVPWLGWGNINVMLPGDTSMYPLKITHIYYEMGKERDDFGVLIFDKLEAFFSNHTEEVIQDEKIKASDFMFYEVQPGDTITGISRKTYGTEKYKNEIMANNEIKAGDVLTVGKILVLVKR
jgi:type IV pilus assembly protein PilO